MVTLEPITAGNVALFREVRLRALQDAPLAFGSTYARESQFSDGEWLRRVTRWNGESGIGYLAMEGGHGCGIAGVLLEEEDGACATPRLDVGRSDAPEMRCGAPVGE